ncbi:MAG: fumarylacetoacetate hydrolase family protein [Phaeovulum sp.]|uniref:fumarylacetoacetate hydrolase family protein n=1 Tax=Phaeovulum sp. TaxID=2934796 RepID=UPI002731D153|nr:fumarylacetoacetate hydrolase family protein [Phaeovulum sp.]MDP2062772.1 fumarylacetoacetate hydrolase family protein [Phaeovulum sp.]MDP3862373.1 fumarylacetoacetate hydrolase family protein [Phaeovulum sp.]
MPEALARIAASRPLGPWLVTPDEVPDPQALRLWLAVDGVTRQRGTTATGAFGVANRCNQAT